MDARASVVPGGGLGRVGRRAVAGLAALGLAACGPAQAAAPKTTEGFLGISTLRLWDGPAPRALGEGPEDVPELIVFKPERGREVGTAVLVAPGGGYVALSGASEGTQVAAWFTARGVTAFVLRYRLAPRYRLPVPVLDGQRAVRWVRAHAAEYGVRPDRIGVIGFSAGGHLAATLATRFDAGAPSADDPVERVSDRPDFVVLAYPAVRFTAPDRTQERGSMYCAFMHVGCEAGRYTGFRPDREVRADSPPAFIFHTDADQLIDPMDSVLFYQALRAAHVPAELHVFAVGEHGVALGGGDATLDAWPGLMEAWMRRRGLLPIVQPVPPWTPDPADSSPAPQSKSETAPR